MRLAASEGERYDPPMVAADAPDSEIVELAGLVRAHLEWAETIGGNGLDGVAIEAAKARRATSSPPAPPPPPPAPTPAPEAARLSAPEAPPAVFDAPARTSTPEERRQKLSVLADGAAACTKCELHRGRTKSVFARGSADATLAFVGEGPGYHEDQQGEPFVGQAGQLLDKMIGAMKQDRDGVYICNIVKCRPPENRTPLPPEAAACSPWLLGQLEVIAPKVIVALGRCASENLGCTEIGERGWRGRWREWRGIPVMSTYHPAFLLRSPQFKKQVWEDLQKVMARLGAA